MIDASVLLYFSFDSSLLQSRSMEQVVPAVHLTFYRLAVVIRDRKIPGSDPIKKWGNYWGQTP